MLPHKEESFESVKSASKSNIETIEVLHENSAAAIHKCEGCLKELNRTLEHQPENLACEDCCKEQERLDPNEENRNEENPPRCSCTEESLCQGCEEAMEKLFGNKYNEYRKNVRRWI